jgi:hypothetical protein
MLKVKSFLRALSRGMKPGFNIMNQNPKDNPWNGDSSSLVKRKFKSAPSAGKRMLTLFWDMNGPVLEH